MSNATKIRTNGNKSGRNNPRSNAPQQAAQQPAPQATQPAPAQPLKSIPPKQSRFEKMVERNVKYITNRETEQVRRLKARRTKLQNKRTYAAQKMDRKLNGILDTMDSGHRTGHLSRKYDAVQASGNRRIARLSYRMTKMTIQGRYLQAQAKADRKVARARTSEDYKMAKMDRRETMRMERIMRHDQIVGARRQKRATLKANPGRVRRSFFAIGRAFRASWRWLMRGGLVGQLHRRYWVRREVAAA